MGEMLSSGQEHTHDHKAENTAELVDVAGTTGADSIHFSLQGEPAHDSRRDAPVRHGKLGLIGGEIFLKPDNKPPLDIKKREGSRPRVNLKPD